MVAILRPVGNQAIREVSVAMSEFLKNNEWASQHGLDGKIWTIDHRFVWVCCSIGLISYFSY